MILLFTSYACDYCEGHKSPDDYYSGYIVYQPKRVAAGKPFFVFRSRTDAAIWRSAKGLQEFELREVLSEQPFTWRRSTGSISDIELASRPFEIFLDHRFEPLPNRAFLAPVGDLRAA